MAAPEISVLMPVRNAAATLPATLLSLRRQRGARWECVAVDDGSTDGSLALLRQASAEDPRFVVAAQRAQGIVPSLNHGLSLCRGRLVARMDADDLMHRDRLRAQAEALRSNPALSGVGCHVRLFPRRGLQAGRLDYERWLNSLSSADSVRYDALIECPLAHPTLMLRRSVLKAHGYRDAGWAEDYDLVLRLLSQGHQLSVVARKLLHWRDTPARLSRTSSVYGIDRFTACKAHFLAQGFLADTDRYILWGYGNTGRTLCRALMALGKQPILIVEVHPGRIGQRIAGTDVIEPNQLRAFVNAHPGTKIVASVARAGPRGEVRSALASMGFSELSDYVCAA